MHGSNVQHIHILGIAGTFMGGLAVIARELGYRVTGSDTEVYPPMSDTLAQHHIPIYPGFFPEHLQPHPDLVLVGNVCRRGNPAVEYMLNQDIPYCSGPAWLAQTVLTKRHVLAVSGTHGKTTVTSMLAWILTYAGYDPGYLIGGVAHNFSHTAALGTAPYFVIEADEYDSAYFDKRPKFLHYLPKTLVINNIEFDHGDIYADLEAIKIQFHLLVKTVPGKGKILYSDHDAPTREVLDRGIWSRHHIFSAADFPLESLPDIWGLHNQENAMAAITAAQDVGIDMKTAVQALQSFKGVKRRMEKIAEGRGITVYDDFAHHPTAIAKTLMALRSHVGKASRITVVLQFGSNTMRRGQHGADVIARALSEADRVILYDPLEPTLDIPAIAKQICVPTVMWSDVQDIMTDLRTHLQAGDVVLIMSNKNFAGLRSLLSQFVASPM